MSQSIDRHYNRFLQYVDNQSYSAFSQNPKLVEKDSCPKVRPLSAKQIVVPPFRDNVHTHLAEIPTLFFDGKTECLFGLGGLISWFFHCLNFYLYPDLFLQGEGDKTRILELIIVPFS
jgi:hypothetical protein